MRIVSRRRLREFWQQDPRSKSSLTQWFNATRAARWSSLADARATFRHADPVRVRSGNTVTVFNVGGNNYRLVCAVHYDRQTVYVLRVMSHAAYDRSRWKEEL